MKRDTLNYSSNPNHSSRVYSYKKAFKVSERKLALPKFASIAEPHKCLGHFYPLVRLLVSDIYVLWKLTTYKSTSKYDEHHIGHHSGCFLTSDQNDYFKNLIKNSQNGQFWSFSSRNFNISEIKSCTTSRMVLK